MTPIFPLEKLVRSTRVIVRVLPLLLLGGCFDHPKSSVAQMICGTDENCPSGYVCAIPGTVGGCRKVGGARDDASPPTDGDARPAPSPDVACGDHCPDSQSDTKDRASDLARDVLAREAASTTSEVGDVVQEPDARLAIPDVPPDVASDALVIQAKDARPDTQVADARPDTQVLDAPLDPLPDSQPDLPVSLASRLTISPSTRDFSTVTVGSESAASVFTVTNEGDVTSGTMTTSIEGTGFSIATDGCMGLALAARSSCSILLKFIPASSGAKNATLAVTASPGGPASAGLSGSGLTAGMLSVTPQSNTYPDTVIGVGSAATRFVITNTGGSSAGTTTGIQVQLAGGNPSEFHIDSTSCGTILSSGATCDVLVNFLPASSGSKTTSLTVTASPGGTAVASLAGLGLPRCNLVSDGLCPVECTKATDMDCRNLDGVACLGSSDCQSGTCAFGMCCGRSTTCPQCMTGTDCTTDATKPLCQGGICSPCLTDSDCGSRNSSYPVCDSSGACVALPPINWSRTESGLAGRSVSSFAAGGAGIFAGTDMGVYRSTDSGSSWTPINTGLTGGSLHIRSLLLNSTYLFAGTDGAGVFRSHISGFSWTAMNSGLFSPMQIVWSLGVSGPYIIAGFSNGRLARTANYGESWTQLPTVTGTAPPGVETYAFVTLGGRLYTASIDGVWSSTDDGSTWSPVNTGLTSRYTMSLVLRGNDLYAGTATGKIFRLASGSTTWTLASEGLPASGGGSVLSMVESGGNLYACVYGNGVFMSTDGGTSWKAMNRGMPLTENARVLLVSGTLLLAGTDGGGVYRSALP